MKELVLLQIHFLNDVHANVSTLCLFLISDSCLMILVALLLWIYFLNDAHTNVSTLYLFLISGSCLIIVVQNTGALVVRAAHRGSDCERWGATAYSPPGSYACELYCIIIRYDAVYVCMHLSYSTW